MNDEHQAKILIVGDYSFPLYASALYEAMRGVGGVYADSFDISKYLSGNNSFFKLIKRVENKLSAGPDVLKLNNDLINKCRRERYDLVFLYTVRSVTAKTVCEIRECGSKVFSYCNDDPFSDFYPRYFWRNYRDVLSCSDKNYVYRVKNIYDVERVCGVKPSILRSYYLNAMNYPCGKGKMIKDVPEVIFLGHDENDERKEYIASLAENGVKVGVPKKLYRMSLGVRENIVYLENERTLYNRYLCSCKVPLVFLSKINHDTYTRRCFEIPAAGAFLFCPYTEDLASLFEEGKEIIFYRDKQDFLEKIIYYINHDEERNQIAAAGRRRLLKDGHEILDRAKQIITDFKELK